MTTPWLRHCRKLLPWIGGSLAVLLVALAATGYLMYRHLSDNIAQVNLSAYIGKQPADLHPQAENILVIGSGSALGAAAGAAGADSQSGSIMLVHIAADRQWAEVMSIPPDSWLGIPSRTTPGVRLTASVQSTDNQAYPTGSHVALGVARTIRAVERGTGIYINHFIVVNDNGFKGMVGALGGVDERNATAIDNPQAGLVLSPGRHQLTPAQALAYAHGLLGPGGISRQERVALQQALGASLMARARSYLSNPVAAYRFLNTFTGSLTIDSQLGGITGLYRLAQELHGMSANDVAMFALPNYPRADVVLASDTTASDTTGALWTLPTDSDIFASFRDDVAMSPAVLAAIVRPASSLS